MASGHEYRAKRPNTWLLRPTPQVKILLANPEPMVWTPPSRRVGISNVSCSQGGVSCKSFVLV